MLVALGAAAPVISEQVGIAGGDLSRVVQGLLTGVGLLGVGIIFRSERPLHAQGLTTGAGIWLTTSLGMAVEFGRPATVVILSGLGVLTLAPIGRLSYTLQKPSVSDGKDDR